MSEADKDLSAGSAGGSTQRSRVELPTLRNGPNSEPIRAEFLECQVPGPHSPFRGTLSVESSMETLQTAYFHAVVGAARCSLSKPSPDRGIDYQIDHQSDEHPNEYEALLRVALKSTRVDAQIEQTRNYFAFRIKNDHLKHLNYVNPTVNKILVVMRIPASLDEWVHASHDYFEIRHCCYWVNLAGQQPTGGTKTTIRVPTTQIFDDHALCGIMQRIGAGGLP